jgi:glycosyltransferase involved in cell wall biosynthesis
MKKISVITPTLGIRVDGLLRAINSVNDQVGEFEIEHLLICPTGTELPKFDPAPHVNRRIIYFDIRGIYQAMNHGVWASTGHYFVFLGDDDYLLSNSLVHRFNAINSTDYDYVYSKSLYETNSGQVIQLQTTADPFADWFLDLLKFQHASVIFKSECQAKFGDYAHSWMGFELKICADYLWFAKSFNNSAHVGFLSEETVVIGAGGVSSAQILRTFSEGFLIALSVSRGRQKIKSLLSWTTAGATRSLNWLRRKVKNAI